MKTRINLFEVTNGENGKIEVHVTKRRSQTNTYDKITFSTRYRINRQIAKAQREGRLFIWIGTDFISLGIYQKP